MRNLGSWKSAQISKTQIKNQMEHIQGNGTQTCRSAGKFYTLFSKLAQVN